MLLSLILSPLAAAQAVAPNASVPASSAASPVSTAVPSSTASPDTPVIGQDMYPPVQWWCNDGAPYCPGKLLQDVQLARIYPDSKTFSDKPTNGTLNDTLNAFNALGTNVTIGGVTTFVQEHFKGEGLELEEVQIEGFNANPAILSNITDPIYHAWVSQVNEYWTLLVRRTNVSAVCNATGPGACSSSLIPLNHTIVVPGGRYREIYYWDSYWILQGLLASELNNYAWNLLQNFMDLVETYGFLPNGGRKYYLNRSQPPVFTQMVHDYVRSTGNTTILDRALPLLDKELLWWNTNRTIEVKSPWSNKTYTVAHYAVNNSAPRPEGYVEDYNTAHGAEPALNDSQRADLYAELASGAESGWDYSSRWAKQPIINVTDNLPVLRTLNVRAIVPVDLMALMAGNHKILADLYELHQGGGGGGNGSSSGSSTPTTIALPTSASGILASVTIQNQAKRDGSASAASGSVPATPASTPSTPTAVQPSGTPSSDKVTFHRKMAENYTAAILDLNWSGAKSYFYDFNTTSNDRSPVYSPAGLWPLWQNITPPELKGNEALALKIVSGQRYLLGRYAGPPTVASLLHTGLNWDFPNVWPNHVHTTIKAFETLGLLVPNATTLPNVSATFADIPAGQLGLDAAALPLQPAETVGNTSLWAGGAQNPWPLQLSIEVANRYLTDAFCSWYSTGGSLPGVLEQLPISDLNSTGTYTSDAKGHMFEKFNVTDPDAAGGGGEYAVVIGFGWTNGVALWAAGKFGKYLPQPTCPLIPIISNNGTSSGNGTSGAGGTTPPASQTGPQIQPPRPSGASTAANVTAFFESAFNGGSGSGNAAPTPASQSATGSSAPQSGVNVTAFFESALNGAGSGATPSPPTPAAPTGAAANITAFFDSAFHGAATASGAAPSQSPAQKALFRGHRIPRR